MKKNYTISVKILLKELDSRSIITYLLHLLEKNRQKLVVELLKNSKFDNYRYIMYNEKVIL